MLLHFYLRFSTQFGQTLYVSGNTTLLGNDELPRAFPLAYLNENLWHGYIDIDPLEFKIPIRYKYILRQKNEEDVQEFGDDRIICVGEIKTDKLIISDTWNHAGEFENVFYTSAFRDVLLKKNNHNNSTNPKTGSSKTYTHQFKVKAPLLNKNEILCMSGSAKTLKEWNKEKVILLSKNGNWWTKKTDLSKEHFPVVYKYGIYNSRDKKFIKYEEGNNRILMSAEGKKTITIIHDGFANLQNINWKGAGVAIPVFSLRSKNGFGTGEFNDLLLLVDWAKKTGLKMIQLLPVNDTTATYTSKDAYPYSAISAFALHPLLLNLDAVAGKENEAVIKPLTVKKKRLNNRPVLEYEQVIKFKMAAISELYLLQKDKLKDDFAFISFFKLNRHWLEPFAAFSFLRDKYRTAEFNTWRSNSVYNKDSIHRLISSWQKHYDEIGIHYFIQFHLHQQLKAANEYAHKNGIIIKGDIPIGICKNSVDVWMDPALFKINEQAGAPPDAFSVKGQNWGFPTYNWKKMQEDEFAWWHKRFKQMNNYFDAFRIDHILGFFRIWSIPEHAVEGIMGRFVPAKPITINELFGNKIVFDRQRFTLPYFNESILSDLFGKKKEEVKKEFLHEDLLKEKYNTQRKVEDHFSGLETPDPAIKQGLFDLISNVILFEEDKTNGQQFHFRIGMEDTTSFKNLDKHSQDELKKLYNSYFYQRQDELWRKEAMKKLPGLKRNTNMLVCGEDLGMVPHGVPQVMAQLGILSLEIQRMPKKAGNEFFSPNEAPYLSVVSPSTHDMSTIRAWWEEDRDKTKRFYNFLLNHTGEPPVYCDPIINKEIVLQHLSSPAMWSVFQLQDLLGTNEKVRREDPKQERINDPADPGHNWNYRMHISLEDLNKEKDFNEELSGLIKASGR